MFSYIMIKSKFRNKIYVAANAELLSGNDKRGRELGVVRRYRQGWVWFYRDKRAKTGPTEPDVSTEY